MGRSKLTQSVTTEQRVEVKLKPELRAQLSPLIKAVQENNAEIKRLKGENVKKKTEIELAFKKSKAAKALLEGVEVDGTPVKLVCGSQKKVNMDMLVELGCDPDWIEEATETKDKKPYIKIGAGED